MLRLCFFYPQNQAQLTQLQPFIEKMKNNELSLEDILDEKEIIMDLLQNENSKFLNMINFENIRKLIDYATKFPTTDEPKIAYSYPFHSAKILCSDNNSIIDRIMNEIHLEDDSDEEEDNFKKINENEKNQNNANIIESKLEESPEQEKLEFPINQMDNTIKDDTTPKHQKEILYDNVDYLLQFLISPEETKSNYVLGGYFYDIVNHLITSRPFKMIPYLLDYPLKNKLDVIGQLVKNMNRKSIAKIINTLLLFDEKNDELNFNLNQKKKELLFRILEELKNTEELDKYQCICSTLEYIFCDDNFFIEIMLSQKIIELCFNILDESKKISKKYIAVMKLITRINERILKNIKDDSIPIEFQDNLIEINNSPLNNNFIINDKENNDEYNSKKEQNIKFILINILQLLEKNKLDFVDDLDNYSIEENSEFLTTYQKTQKRIGFKKLTQIIIFKSILNIIIISYIKYKDLREQILKIVDIIKDKNIFWKMHKLFLDFPFCNIYQIYYKQIFDIILYELTPESLIKSVFINKKDKEEKNIIQLFIDYFINNIQLKYSSNNISFIPIFLFIVKILEKISSSKNECLKNMIKNNKNLEIFNLIIVEEIKMLERKFTILSDNDLFHCSRWVEFEPYFVKKKNLIELIEEDISIYKIYLEGGDYQKLLDEKVKRENHDKELEEKKRKEEFDINPFENSSQNCEKREENENQENLSEESEQIKKYNDVNFWKNYIMKNNDIMNEVLNDLD